MLLNRPTLAIASLAGMCCVLALFYVTGHSLSQTAQSPSPRQMHILEVRF